MGGKRSMGRLLATLLFAVKALGLALLAYAIVMFVAQRRVVFPGTSREPGRTAATAPPGVTQVWLEPSFGRVEAWYFRAPGADPGPAVLFAHGNGELIDDWLEEMNDLSGGGVHTLLVEFPGYGFSEGDPSRATMRETFNAAYDWLTSQNEVDGERIVAYGRSLGGGAAADLTLDRPVGALALQSTFTSTPSLAREMLLPGFLVRDRFDNLGAVASFDGPVLLMHGVDDDVIAYDHAEGLASARPGLEVTELDCAHNDCASEWPVIRGSLLTFLGANGLL
jgi:pimeloyl-ACP methyl ester carboxylesterase